MPSFEKADIVTETGGSAVLPSERYNTVIIDENESRRTLAGLYWSDIGPIASQALNSAGLSDPRSAQALRLVRRIIQSERYHKFTLAQTWCWTSFCGVKAKIAAVPSWKAVLRIGIDAAHLKRRMALDEDEWPQDRPSARGLPALEEMRLSGCP